MPYKETAAPGHIKMPSSTKGFSLKKMEEISAVCNLTRKGKRVQSSPKCELSAAAMRLRIQLVTVTALGGQKEKPSASC